MRRLLAALAMIAAASPVLAQNGPNGLQKMMLYRSFVQDDPACSVTVENGQPVFVGPQAASAAATCPDAFAWAQLAESISESWWDWAIDQTIWPGSPLPLCTASVTENCCDPDAAVDPTAAPPTQCPYFRADYDPPSPLPAVPNGEPNNDVIDHGGLRLADAVDPGRLLRDLELELVFRNRAMFDYIYRNDMYTREGLGARNKAQNAALNAGDIAGAHALTVRYPVDAVMVKADFLHQQVMLDRGLIQTEDANGNPIDPPNNPDYPYLTVEIDGTGAEGEVPGLYYMLAMTNASKDLPIWHWYALEHVANLGRCDYIGCNDSFGYSVDGTAQAGADFGTTYIPPMIELNDDKVHNNDPLFVTGQFYDPAQTGETITPELQALFEGMGIATATADPDPSVISADDPAWLNYRLKGTQTTFNTAAGVPTGTGATITEGGFVNSASCTTCHSQSSTDDEGQVGLQGVGASWTPNLLGYGRVVMGAPIMDWFYANGGPSVTNTQLDFVWGVLFAQCVTPGDNGNCAAIPDAPTIVPASGN